MEIEIITKSGGRWILEGWRDSQSLLKEAGDKLGGGYKSELKKAIDRAREGKGNEKETHNAKTPFT